MGPQVLFEHYYLPCQSVCFFVCYSMPLQKSLLVRSKKVCLKFISLSRATDYTFFVILISVTSQARFFFFFSSYFSIDWFWCQFSLVSAMSVFLSAQLALLEARGNSLSCLIYIYGVQKLSVSMYNTSIFIFPYMVHALLAMIVESWYTQQTVSTLKCVFLKYTLWFSVPRVYHGRCTQ